MEFAKTNLLVAKRDEEKALYELNSSVNKAKNYSAEISKINSDSINEEEEVNKSMVFGLNELLDKFDSLSGLSKLLCTYILSSSLILWCLFTIILNLYGNYLDRFSLEEKYPKIALLINYRKKVSKYYLISNFLIIIIMCLINITLALSILSL